jgi:hypothetical protein
MRFFLLILLTAALAGCGSTRGIYDAAGAAGGGILAHELSGGDPVITGAGAGAGVLAAEALQTLGEKSRTDAYVRGYDRGRSDAVKQHYWSLQENREPSDTYRQVSIPGPSVIQTPAGPINTVPHDLTLTIIE